VELFGHLGGNAVNRHEGRLMTTVASHTHHVRGAQNARGAAVFECSRGAAAAPLPRGYQPRRPQTTAFYRVIADHLETMLQDARDRSPHGFGLPRHVEGSFRRFLDCGVATPTPQSTTHSTRPRPRPCSCR